MRVWILLFLLVVGAGLFLWLDPFAGDGLVVHVGVIDAATGEPLVGAMVKSRFNDAWVTTDKDGMARLTNVALPPRTDASAAAIARVLELSHRSAVASSEPPDVTRGEDGEYAAVITAESFGILTITVEPTILPNVRAYVELSESVRAVPVDGRGVARIAQSASYRIFGSAARIPVVLKGDMGVGMQRWMVRAPGPGATIQRSYAATAATPISGQVLLRSKATTPPPALSGVLQLVPDGWPASAVSEELEVLGPIDSVVIRADGGFDIPHILPGAWRPVAQLDFLGPIEVSAPLVASRASTGWSIPAAVRTHWVRLRLPADAPLSARNLAYEITRTPASDLPARVVHHEDASYLVLPEQGTWQVRVHQPGSQEAAPRQFLTSYEAEQPGAGELVVSAFEDVPFGTLVIDVPDAVSKAMQGGTLRLANGRETSILADLTKRIEFEHVRAGTRSVTVTWRDRNMAPFEATVDVKAGERSFVVVERTRRAR